MTSSYPFRDGSLIAERGAWRFVWHGGRLCDVYHAEYESVIDCTQVDGWEDEHGDTHALWPKPNDPASVTAAARALRATADEWMVESEPDYRRELPYMR
jgi:hypothetical protein